MKENEENKAPNEKETAVKENKEEEEEDNSNEKTETKPELPENGCIGLFNFTVYDLITNNILQNLH